MSQSPAAASTPSPALQAGAGGNVETYNASLDVEPGIAVLADSAIRDATTWKWVVTGAANYATTDGTHPTTAAANLLSTALQASLP